MSSRRALICALAVAVAFTTGLGAQDVRDTVGPLEKQANPVTPENPIPRRTLAVTAIYPSEARAVDAMAIVVLAATLDEAGRVVEIRKVREPFVVSPLSPAPSADLLRSAGEALVRYAAIALRQWQYDPPATAPLSFTVTFTFTPKADPSAAQSVTAPGGSVGTGTVTGGSIPPPPPFANTGGLQPIRVGGNIRAPEQIVKVPPSYPLIAQSARVQGVVILEALIGTDGRVADARVLRSIPLLDQAALDAVRQWEYTPTLLNGAPTPVIMTVTVQFTLPEPPPQQ